MRFTTKLCLPLFFTVLFAAAPATGAIRVPFDPEALKAAEAKARDAQDEANFPALQRAYRRWLEFYPNEPAMQAALYQAMALAAEKSGDPAQSEELHALALSLDPTIDKRLTTATKIATTRGDSKGDKFGAIFGVIMQTAAAVQQQRQIYQQQKAAAMQMQAMQQAQQGQQYAYPAAPVGAAGYQPPQGPPAPMPGYGYPNPGYQAPPQGYAPSQGVPPAQQPGGYPPSPAGYPQQAQGYQPSPGYPPPSQGNPTPPQPGYAQQPGYSAPPSGYPAPQQVPYGQPAQPNMYAAPPGYAPPPGATRGSATKPVKVVFDESRFGSAAYFEPSAGALLAVDGSKLTFTSSGGEAPRVIPASDIREIRLNSVVGTSAGAFHIATKKGLYLHLAPPSGSSDDAREIVASLRKQLGIEP